MSNHRTSCELAGLVSLLSVSPCILAVMDGTSESPIEISSGEDFEHRIGSGEEDFEHRISSGEEDFEHRSNNTD